MSQYDYEVSKRIEEQDAPFYALIMAAMRRADTRNLMVLARDFPAVYAELDQRYNAPGGVLPSDCGDYPAPCNCDDPVLHNGH